MKKEKGKVIKSIYMDEDTARMIEKKAIKERRNFSFVANDILNQWASKNKTKGE